MKNRHDSLFCQEDLLPAPAKPDGQKTKVVELVKTSAVSMDVLLSQRYQHYLVRRADGNEFAKEEFVTENQEIHKVVRHLESAWNASDSVAFARVFARDADFIHIIGGHYRGQEAIQEGHRQIWDTIYKDSKVVYDIEGIRQIRPDIAIAFVL